MNDYRQLQRQCESEAALASTPGAREALLEMAAEYRRHAECEERQRLEPRAPTPHRRSPADALSGGTAAAPACGTEERCRARKQ
jgi:hypothetical protein